DAEQDQWDAGRFAVSNLRQKLRHVVDEPFKMPGMAPRRLIHSRSAAVEKANLESRCGEPFTRVREPARMALDPVQGHNRCTACAGGLPMPILQAISIGGGVRTDLGDNHGVPGNCRESVIASSTRANAPNVPPSKSTNRTSAGCPCATRKSRAVVNDT